MVMKIIPQAFFLALFVFAVSSFAQAQPIYSNPEGLWNEFSSVDGRFKVALPGSPSKNSWTIESSLGKIQRHTFGLATDLGDLSVSYSDLPVILSEPGEVNKFLDHVHDDKVASLKGKLRSVAEIALDGYPGRECIVEASNSKYSWKYKTKYYLAGQRVYEITIGTLNIHTENAEVAKLVELVASRFFDSFKITGKPAMGEKTTPEPKKIAGVETGRVDPGSVLTKVAPAYPPEAREAGVSGKVQVQVTIAEEGWVMEATAISGPKLLREAAVQAARLWVFKPTKLDGAPVKVQGILTFNFEM
jgi:TonB family protein